MISDIVCRVRDGDELAMKLLYDEYAKEMLTLAYRMTNNLSDAEDIIQESFIRSFQVIDQLKEDSHFKAWLKRIVLNKSISRIRNRKIVVPLEQKDMVENKEEGRWYEAIPFDLIQQAIQNLPNGCREILTLYLLDDFKHREIAEMLSISVSTSKSQYQYGLKLLRNNLRKYINGRV